MPRIRPRNSAAQGIVERYHAPGGPGVRMDSHLYTGYEISTPYYDSTCSASSSSGPGRPTAIARGRVASTSWSWKALVTNVRSTGPCCANEDFLDGRFTTNLLDRVGGAAIVAAAARS